MDLNVFSGAESTTLKVWEELVHVVMSITKRVLSSP